MKSILVFFVCCAFVSVLCQDYNAADAAKAMRKAIDAQNDENAKKYVKEILMPKIKLAAEGGKGRVRYPSTWNECSSRPDGLDWGSVASILKEKGFDAKIGEKTAYQLLTDPPPRFTTLDIIWDGSKGGVYDNINIVAPTKLYGANFMDNQINGG